MKLLNQILNKISSNKFNQVHSSLGALSLIASAMNKDEDILNSFCVLAFDEVPNRNFSLKEYISRKADVTNGLNLVQKHLIAKEVSKHLKDASAFYDVELAGKIDTQANFKQPETIKILKSACFGDVAYVDNKYHLVNPLTKKVTAEYIVDAADANFSKLHELIGEARKAGFVDSVVDLDGDLVVTTRPGVSYDLANKIEALGYEVEEVDQTNYDDVESVPTYNLRIKMSGKDNPAINNELPKEESVEAPVEKEAAGMGEEPLKPGEQWASDEDMNHLTGWDVVEGNDYYQIYKHFEQNKYKIWDIEQKDWYDGQEIDDLPTAEKMIENLAEGLPEKTAEEKIDFEKDLMEAGESKGEKDKVNETQLAMGKEVEKEHTTNPEIAEKITRDHLKEMPDYYTHLKEMEENAKENDAVKSSYAPFITIDATKKDEVKIIAGEKIVGTCKDVKAAFEKSANEFAYDGNEGARTTHKIYEDEKIIITAEDQADEYFVTLYVGGLDQYPVHGKSINKEKLMADADKVNFAETESEENPRLKEFGVTLEMLEKADEEATKVLKGDKGPQGGEAEAPVEASAKSEVTKTAEDVEDNAWVVEKTSAPTIDDQLKLDIFYVVNKNTHVVAHDAGFEPFLFPTQEEAQEHADKLNSQKEASIKPEVKKEAGESYGWVVNSEDAWDKLMLWEETVGAEQALRDVAKAMGDEELSECLAYIFRMNDFKEGCSDEFDVESSKKVANNVGNDKTVDDLRNEFVSFVEEKRPSDVNAAPVIYDYFMGLAKHDDLHNKLRDCYGGSEKESWEKFDELLNLVKYWWNNYNKLNNVESAKEENIEKKADEELKQFDMKQELDGQKEFEKQDDFSQVSVPEEKEDTSEVAETMEAKPEETKGESFSASEFGNNMAYIQQNKPEAFKAIMNNLKQLMVGDEQKIYNFLENWASHNFQDFTAMTREDPTYARHSQYQEQLKNNVLPKLKEMSEYKQAMEEKVSAEKGNVESAKEENMEKKAEKETKEEYVDSEGHTHTIITKVDANREHPYIFEHLIDGQWASTSYNDFPVDLKEEIEHIKRVYPINPEGN